MYVPQSVWRWKIATYLFLAGMGAGSYLAGVYANWVSNATQGRTGIVLGVVLVAISTLFLISDLGVPGQFYLAFSRPGKSWISRGTWILTGFIIIALVHIGLSMWPLQVIGNDGPATATLYTLGVLFALATSLYTGLLIGVLPGRPFWYSPIIPVIFLVSAISTGIGAFILLTAIFTLAGQSPNIAQLIPLLESLARIDIVLIVAEALAIFLHLVIASRKAGDSVKALISGRLAGYFWGGLVGIGLFIPLLLDIMGMLPLSAPAKLTAGVVASICLLVGGLLLRWLVLSAGIRTTIYVRTQFQVRPGV